MKNKTLQPVLIAAALSLGYVILWRGSVLLTGWLEWYELRATLALFGTIGMFVLGLAWLIWGLERAAQYFEKIREQQHRDAQVVPVLHKPLRKDADDHLDHVWNPLDPAAWYYGRRHKRLNQSLSALTTYALLFFLMMFILTQMSGCGEDYEMPAGGGEQQITQQIKVQKIIRQKFVVNPFSAILFNVPPIDQMVKLNLNEITKHAYTVGYGKGDGAGFAGGTKRGKVRFIRLEYSGGDWNQNFGVGADLNMLNEYGIRTQQKVEKKTESRRVIQLKNFRKGKSPPMVYLTGQKNISLSNSEIKVLRKYLVEDHGMIFGSNGGSRHFHNQFLSAMGRVLPDVRPVVVPLDDPIHAQPNHLPFLPIVAPHGGNQALGWYKDGRWLCYYHPGDIGDAWCDDHAGVKADVSEACYQLGTNVIFYAHMEYSKWLQSQQKDKKGKK